MVRLPEHSMMPWLFDERVGYWPFSRAKQLAAGEFGDEIRPPHPATRYTEG
jgi:hypothetical protein